VADGQASLHLPASKYEPGSQDEHTTELWFDLHEEQYLGHEVQISSA
jgi:hypothetical protein